MRNSLQDFGSTKKYCKILCNYSIIHPLIAKRKHSREMSFFTIVVSIFVFFSNLYLIYMCILQQQQQQQQKREEGG